MKKLLTYLGALSICASAIGINVDSPIVSIGGVIAAAVLLVTAAIIYILEELRGQKT